MASKFKIEPIDQGLQDRIDALVAAGQGQALFKNIGHSIGNRIRLCFKLGIDPWGNPWAPLKIRKGQPLRDTGRLQASITSRSDANGVSIGTNVKYAPPQQFGASIVPKKPGGRLVFPGANGKLVFSKGVTIPARPFLPIKSPGSPVVLPPSWAIAVVKSLREYFKKAGK